MKTTQKRLVSAIALAMMAGSASSILAQPIELGLLGGSQGIRIDGAGSDDFAAASITGAGDINGDGIPDIVIGSPGVNSNFGQAYVMFGRTETGIVNLGDQGTGGFPILGYGSSAGDPHYAGASVSGVGDVNGDGLDDVVVGLPGRTGFTPAVVVFGKQDSRPVDLSNVGRDGFVIEADTIGARFGQSVSGAGDVNGDGFDDIVIGQPYSSHFPANGSERIDAGRAFIIFGKDDSRPVDVNELDEGGTIIEGIDTDQNVGRTVSGAGDVNGDGLADVVIGAGRGATTFVIFGQDIANTVRVDDLGLRGYAIQSDRVSQVSGAGDVNGDGFADLVIGSNYADSDRGRAFVVFGKRDVEDVAVSSLGDGGFTIFSDIVDGLLGTSVAGAGDINGDGLADIIVGAPQAYYTNPLVTNGMAYIVYGKSEAADVDLGIPDSGHRSLIGAAVGDYAGFSVAGAGDVNGDGLADLLVGATRAAPGGATNAGSAYLIFSSDPPAEPVAVFQQWTGPDNTPQTAIGVSGDRSNHTTPDSRVWIDFTNGRGFLRPESLQSVFLHREGSPIPNPGVDMYWRLNTGRRNYSNVTVTFKYLENELLVPNETDLQLFYSREVDGPYTQITANQDTVKNTLSARVNELGYFFIGGRIRPDPLFSDSFE